MICPVCEQLETPSTLYVSRFSRTTDMCIETFYDPSGEFHYHDPNRSSRHWHCSNKHEGWISDSKRCSAPGCTFGEDGSISVSVPKEFCRIAPPAAPATAETGTPDEGEAKL
jgi:hypothetical protein